MTRTRRGVAHAFGRGTTLVEALIVLAFTVLLGTVCVPLATRALRTTLQVTGRAGLQSGLRGSLENIVRDLHQSHHVMERTSGVLVLFRPDGKTVGSPEGVVSANQVDPGGLPHFPLAGLRPESGRHVALPGSRVRYHLDKEKSALIQTHEPGRILGTVTYDPASRRTAVSGYTFESTEPPKVRTLATGVVAFEPIAFAYGPSGRLKRSVDALDAVGVVVRIRGSVTPEGDRPDAPVVEEIVAKAWLMQRLSGAIHNGAAAAYDEVLDF